MNWMSLHDLTNPMHPHQRERLVLDTRKQLFAEEQARQELQALHERNGITSEYNRGKLELERQRLEFDIQRANLEHLTAQEVAKIQAESSERVARMQLEAQIFLERLRNKHAIDQIKATEEAKVDSAYSMLSVQVTQATIKNNESINEALANTISQSVLNSQNNAFAMDFERLKEANREREREHEIQMAILQSSLKNGEFTHEELTKIMAKLLHPGEQEITKNDAELFAKYEKWKGSWWRMIWHELYFY